MNHFRHLFANVVVVILIAALNSSCSAQAKKSRALRRADEYYQKGDYDKAKIEYTNVLRVDPKDAEAFLKIGSIWLQEGAPLRAGPFLMRAKELAPARAEVRTKLAEIYLGVSGTAEARKEALEALRLEPGNEDALLALSDASRTKEEIDQADAELKKSAGKDSLKLRMAGATLALRRNDLAAMEVELQKALALDPKSWMAHLALARFRLSQNNREAAGQEFKSAADAAPPRSTAQLMYAEFKTQSNAPDEAIAHLNEIVKKAPDYLPAWTLLAKITASKNMEQALALLDNVFRRDTQNFDARMLEADFFILKGDSKKAVDALKQLETNYQKIPIVKVELARALLQNGDPAQALTSLDQALALAPGYNDAILLQAETNLRLGNAAAVVTAMEDLLKTNPTMDRAQVMLADAYRVLGRFDDAAGILRKRIAAAPNQGDLHLMLGVLLRQQGNKPEARAELEKAYELSPNKLAAANQLIEMDIEGGDYASALNRVNPALEKYPDTPGLLLLQGKIYAAQKDWDRAEAPLLKVLQSNASVQAVYDLLVSVYIGAQKLPQAAAQIEAFLAKNPDNMGALMTLALVYSEMKQYEKARDAYEKLLAAKPDNTVAANNLAYIYADELKQLDKARDWAAKARSGDPNNPAIADTFGWILYRQGDYKQAATLLKEAAEKLPAEPEVQYHYAMAGYMMGDTQAARVGFEAAALAPREFPGKEEAKKRLELIKSGGSASEASLEQLEALIKQQPNDPVALAKIAEIYDRQGAAPKAAEYYEQAIKANPNLPGPMIKVAQLYAGPLNKKDRAMELAKKARDMSPSDPRTTSILGRLAFDIGNYTWSYSLLQESSRQLGNDPGVLTNLAWAAYANSKVAESRQVMERLVKNIPDSPEAVDAKKFLAFTAPEVVDGDATALATDVQQKLKDDPAYVPALMLQGQQQLVRGEKEPAIRSFTEVLKRFPDFAPAQKRLAGLYLADPNQRGKAYELANSARKILTDDSELGAILGEASFYKKDYIRAVQTLQESNRKKPLDARHLYFLGMSLIETKHAPEGRDTLQRAITGGLPEDLAAEAGKAVKPPENKSK